jgi:aspartate/methionine/tyrosine aminotransferase
LKIPTVDPFRAIGLSTLAYRMAADGTDVIHMEFGQPSTGAPKAAIAVAHDVLDSDAMGYWQSPELKQRIADHYRDDYGVTVSPEQIFLTCGASPAFVLALHCCFAPGARIALARPGYVAYRNTLRTLSMEPVEIECGEAERFQLSAASLAKIDPAPDGVIIASPANPTGTILPREEMQAIVALCKDRSIRMISDEIYHGLSYSGAAPSMLEFDPDTLIVNSFSKYYSMVGWRLGWLVVPPDLIEAADARIGCLYLSPPSLSQHAALAAFDCGDELQSHVAMYRRNRDLMLESLPSLGLNRIAPPDGAFYIYADISAYTDDSFAFCMRLLTETGVATAPGVDFDPVNGHRFMRFSFAVSTDRIEAALSRLKPWFAAQKRLT